MHEIIHYYVSINVDEGMYFNLTRMLCKKLLQRKTLSKCNISNGYCANAYLLTKINLCINFPYYSSKSPFCGRSMVISRCLIDDPLSKLLKSCWYLKNWPPRVVHNVDIEKKVIIGFHQTKAEGGTYVNFLLVIS